MKLKKERDLSFEEVVDAIINDKFYGVFDNASKNHPGQKVLLVEIKGYPCIVPYTEDKSEVLLKNLKQ